MITTKENKRRIPGGGTDPDTLIGAGSDILCLKGDWVLERAADCGRCTGVLGVDEGTSLDFLLSFVSGGVGEGLEGAGLEIRDLIIAY